MIVSLAVPSISDFYFTPHRMTALGARVAESILRQKGHRARLFDFPKGKSKKIPLPASLAYLNPFLISHETGPISFFTHYRRMGPTPQQCALALLEPNPEIVFVSCFAFAYAEDSLALIREISSLRPNLPIIVGGAGATVAPDIFLEQSGRIMVLGGEAEVGLPPLLDVLADTNLATLEETRALAEVPNLHYLLNGRHHHPKQPKRTTQHDLSVVWLEREGRHRTSFTLSLSRGCPKRCIFCSNHLCHGREFRTVPFSLIDEELGSGLLGSRLKKTDFSVPIQVNFEDDNLLAQGDYFYRVLAALQRTRPKNSQIAIFAENGLDMSLLNTHSLSQLTSLGMAKFNLSLVSADRHVLGINKRTENQSRLFTISRYLASRKIPLVTYLIFGLPGDTPESSINSLLFLHSLPTMIGGSLYYPVPGMSENQSTGAMQSDSTRRFAGSSAFPWNGSLDTNQLLTCFRLSRFLNLLKKASHTDTERQLIETIFSKNRLMTKITGVNTPMEIPGMDDFMITSVLNSAR